MRFGAGRQVGMRGFMRGVQRWEDSWGLGSQRPPTPFQTLEASSFRYSEEHQKFKKCSPYILRLSLKYSEYHEISGRGEIYHFCSLKK